MSHASIGIKSASWASTRSVVALRVDAAYARNGGDKRRHEALNGSLNICFLAAAESWSGGA